MLMLPIFLTRREDAGAPRYRIALAKRSIVAAIAYAIPPTATYFVITAVNRSSATSGSVLEFVKPGWQWDKLLTTDPIQALITIPLGIQPVFDRMWRLVEPAFS